MEKSKKMFLMLCLLIPTAFCLAKGVDGTEVNQKQDDGTPVVLIRKSYQSGSQKDEIPITAYISGHTLTVNFAQNIGIVDVEISDGQSFMVVTPDSTQAYITSSGNYTVTFTLANGDEYYGNFVVFW